MNVNAKNEYKKKFTMNTKPQPLFYVPTPTFASALWKEKELL